MSLYGGLEDHPDLNDAEWGRRVEREFNKENRGRKGLVIGLGVSLAMTGLVVGGLFLGGVVEGPAAPPAPQTETRIAVVSPRLDFTRPFVGTEFESWGNGTKGVVAEPEHEQVRQAVIATWLDPAPLKEGTKLLPDGIKAHGIITPAVGADGTAVVRASYQFVYAFAHDGRAGIRSHDDFLVSVRVIDDYQLTPQGPRVVSSTVRVDHAACSTKQDGLLAPQYLNAGQSC